MNAMTTFHRIHLNLDEDAGPRRIELRVRPDHVQDPSGRLVTVLACSEFDELQLCLEELGMTGRSRFVRESESGQPIFENVPCAPAEVVDRVRAVRPRTITLFAEDASIGEMLQRIERLAARTESGILVLPTTS